jgi:hypothetical protein
MEFARRGEIIFITDFPFRSDLGMDVFTMREIERMRAIPELRRRKQ